MTRGEGGRPQVLLQDLSYSQGIGWYVQKTIRLDPQQVDALLRSLCCVRKEAASRAAGRSGSGQIIQISRCGRD